MGLYQQLAQRISFNRFVDPHAGVLFADCNLLFQVIHFILILVVDVIYTKVIANLITGVFEEWLLRDALLQLLVALLCKYRIDLIGRATERPRFTGLFLRLVLILNFIYLAIFHLPCTFICI